MSTKITLLELRGYKRFALNKIHNFIFRPTEKVQVILGTNGSGKSSLLKELNPLPAHPSNYSKDGYKIIHISKNKDRYRLESRFDPKPMHSFWKNDENLNQGGTITVQRDLVYQEFGVDQEIVDLLTYKERFTSMGPIRRREWFTRLDEASYDYAITVFNRLKERHRDLVGAKKLAKKRLVLETSKVVSEVERERLQREISSLHESITVLLENKTPNQLKIGEVYDKLEETQGLLAEASNAMLRAIAKLDSQTPLEYGLSSVAAIPSRLFELHGLISVEEAIIRESVDEHSKLDMLQKTVQDSKGEGVSDVEEAVRPIIEERSKLTTSKRLNLEFEEESETVLQVVETVEDILLNVFLNIQEDKENIYTVQEYERVKELIVELTLKKDQISNVLNRLIDDRKHLEHLRDGVKTNCPRCNHIWTPGYNPDAYALVLEKIEKKAKEIEELENGPLKKASEKKEELVAYLTLERDYNRCKRGWSALLPLWNYIEQENILKQNPKYISVLIDQLKADLLADIKVRKLDERLKDLDVLKQTLIKEKISNLQEIEDRLEKISLKVSEHTGRLTKLKAERADITRYQDAMVEINKMRERIIELYAQSSTACDDLIESERQAIINLTIKELQLSLANKEAVLSEINNQNQIVGDLERQITLLSGDEEACEFLIKSLSPTDGLIAEGLFGFIKIYVKQMNRLIARTWTYPLVITPCGLDSESEGDVELDYRFPLMVKVPENTVQDVSQGSEAMLEIINTAFLIVAMKYLGLDDYWVILDEFARTMDHEHKRQSVELMKSVMDEKNFSQLYMVSHEFLQYDGIGNKEVCVLSPSNIILPDVYNEHVTIE